MPGFTTNDFRVAGSAEKKQLFKPAGLLFAANTNQKVFSP